MSGWMGIWAAGAANDIFGGIRDSESRQKTERGKVKEALDELISAGPAVYAKKHFSSEDNPLDHLIELIYESSYDHNLFPLIKWEEGGLFDHDMHYAEMYSEGLLSFGAEKKYDDSLLLACGLLTEKTPTYFFRERARKGLNHVLSDYAFIPWHKRVWERMRLIDGFPPRNGVLIVQEKKDNVIEEVYRWYDRFVYFSPNSNFNEVIQKKGDRGSKMDIRFFPKYKQYTIDMRSMKLMSEVVMDIHGDNADYSSRSQSDYEKGWIDIMQQNWEKNKSGFST